MGITFCAIAALGQHPDGLGLLAGYMPVHTPQY
jgi:hypothetical protein